MNNVIERIKRELNLHDLQFTKAPIVIGGMAMEYYGIRKAGSDIDLIICDTDYQNLAHSNPDKRKDIWGDLGIVLDPFEIWRSIMLFDYDFFAQGAIAHSQLFVVSLDRLLFTRVCAKGIKNENARSKYEVDLELIENYYYENLRNQAFMMDAKPHYSVYEKNSNGIVWGGNYFCNITTCGGKDAK